MTKTIKNKNIKNTKNITRKNIKNKTRKNTKNIKVTFIKKREFIKEILKQWKKQTGGCYEKDKKNIYEGDYYLSLNKTCDFYNHIHLVLKHFSNDKNLKNNLLYVFKKMDKNNKVMHSPEIKINVLSDPKIVVRNMIINYKDFSKL
jgi:hypothetical protein